MIDLRMDLREFERAARQIGGALDQVPFALANALNGTALAARQSLIQETWPRHVEVRDRNFLRNALRVDMANKRSLSVAVTNEGTTAGNRAHLKLHARGGTKQARGRLAIPTSFIPRGAKGVPRNRRPGALKNAVVKGNRIFVPEGRGRARKLRLAYVLTPQARMPADVPFEADFQRVMRREMRARFGPAMMRAMRTRR